MGGKSGPGVMTLSWFGRLLDDIVGLLCLKDRCIIGAPGVAELDADASPQHIAAGSTRASEFLSCLEPDGFDSRHLHLQTLLQLQGFRSEATTRLMRQTEERKLDILSPRCRASAGA